METNELASLFCLHSLDRIGTRTLWKIKSYFGSFQACFEASRQNLQASFLSEEIISRILTARASIDRQQMLQDFMQTGGRISCVEDEDYPSWLGTIHDPPYLLYYQGELACLNQLCIGIVGSRRASSYGRTQSRRFGRELAATGITVVSGMARGIDTEAHRGALEAGGKTAAVLGSGLDVIYPAENKALYQEIVAHGVVLTEFSPHTHPEPGNFPVRNRIISGLSRGILVVEAQQKSGALITVDFALEQGRDVFALPGPINIKTSVGSNHLIKQGACMVTEINDILSEYGLVQDNTAMMQQGDIFALNHAEKVVLNLLELDSQHFDELVGQSKLTIGELSTVLLQMELKGIVKALPGNYYVKI
ncbi:MAG TPA: DNA-processing protein DprA [Syntrophomonas sp.]|nr:DNA-processing protein DprA [Syntrophomonas sp.]HRW11892.1 DNA-processing protein DprA [Syntrophomonas sp.]